MLKFDPKEESLRSQPHLGSIPSKISISLPFSTQASVNRSINATSVSRDWLYVNKINNNSQDSRFCRMITEIGPGLNLPKDQTINPLIYFVPLMRS